MYKKILDYIVYLDDLPPVGHSYPWEYIREIEKIAREEQALPAASQTIAGGLTRDNLLDCFKFLDGALPITMLVNHITVCDVLKFTGGGVDRELLAKNGFSMDSKVEGVRTIITTDQEAVPNDQLRILASNGRLYIFDFV